MTWMFYGVYEFSTKFCQIVEVLMSIRQAFLAHSFDIEQYHCLNVTNKVNLSLEFDVCMQGVKCAQVERELH